MPTQREPSPSAVPQPGPAKLSVGQFAERFRGEVIPLSNTFGYFCAAVPMSEELVKEYLEEPVAALPPTIGAMLPKISILLVPYLERSAETSVTQPKRRRRGTDKMADFVVSERPEEGKQSWASWRQIIGVIAPIHFREHRKSSTFCGPSCRQLSRAVMFYRGRGGSALPRAL